MINQIKVIKIAIGSKNNLRFNVKYYEFFKNSTFVKYSTPNDIFSKSWKIHKKHLELKNS